MSSASDHSRNQQRVSTEPLYQVKLLAALRSGDPAAIHPFLADLSKHSGAPTEGQANDPAATALHLAIRCASYETVELLLSHRAISPNAVHPPDSGTTALHLAASIGRKDIVALLLDQEGIDDTLQDSQGLTCKEVAKNREIARMIQDSRTLLNASFLSLLRTYILSPPASPPPAALVALLSSPRIRNVDLNHLEASSGSTLMHEAAKRKDLRLVELSIRAGADVFVRDRRGRGVAEGAGKDDRVKVFLRQFTNQDTTLLGLPVSQTEAPSMKGYLTKYANVAQGYNTRWFVLKDGMLSYYRHQEDENLACRGSLSMKNARIKKSSTDKLRFEIHASTRNGEGIPEKWYIKANHAVEVSRWVQTLQRAIDWSKKDKAADSDTGSIISRTVESSSLRAPRSLRNDIRPSSSSMLAGTSRRNGHGSGSPASSRHESIQAGHDHDEAASDSESFDQIDTTGDQPPYHDNFDLHENSTTAQFDVTLGLLDALADKSSSPNEKEATEGLKESFNATRTMFVEHIKMAHERELWFRAKLTREKERAGIWEQSLRAVVQEGEEMEVELRKSMRSKKQPRRRSKLFSEADTGNTLRRKQTGSSLPPASESPVRDAPHISVLSQAQEEHSEPTALTKEELPTSVEPPYNDEYSDDEDDSQDEFFDAIEANALPGLVITGALASPSAAPLQSVGLNVSQFVGYEDPRHELSISADNRPPVSLWAVLKGSIGKDLTKISFPVFFNEPTSMLQRMAEDMEFSECLDAAAVEPDQFKRIAYVAAFAMSNYSSTIGRIAKPFNPMLGETFEYVRLDKGFTYVSEQVCHHPPISACWADSPSWHYYGEVDAKNKFAGKSFEIRPTGVAHADLKLPKSWAPTYPPASQNQPGKVIEHFSWKKVTTNVSGFILGSPTIDHYGEMTVLNHRTGDTCVLTFKPRGWRAKDSFEIKGQVFDAAGNVKYDIAGRWNSQLVARPAGNHAGELLPDVTVDSGPISPSAAPEYLLLWRNTVKPTAPFNLSPFAITLNDCPEETLKPYLPPTDCRLRPDQRAFELGRYERANELKSEQEDFQRVTRRKRELGEIPPHRPRWFEAKTEPDTGERYWAPIRQGEQLEYWYQRERVFDAKSVGQPFGWEGVDNIFLDVEI